MRELIGWVVYYTNAVYSSDGFTWQELPRKGVQVLCKFYQKDGRKWRELVSGSDAYCIGSIETLNDVKEGIEIDEKEYLNLYHEVNKNEWRYI